VGKLIFGPRTQAVLWLGLAAVAFAVIARNLRDDRYIKALLLEDRND
jgi:hypothetical protein